MKLYRIYTENKNKETVIKVLGKVWNGFTVIEATGYWQGSHESSLIIERVGEDTEVESATLQLLAHVIKTINEQTSVLVTEQKIEVKFV